jgi:ornithine carbamoyltransferase
MKLRNRHFLKLLDLSPTELEQLVQSALTLRTLRNCSQDRAALKRRNLALAFCQNNPQHLWTAQSACSKQGASGHHFSTGQTGFEKGEPVACNARHLGRLFDAILLYGLEQEKVEEVARLAGKPVCNLGSNEFQPLPVVADFATMKGHSSKPLSELSVVLLGDGTTNISQSLLVGASKLGLDLRFCGPKSLQPEENLFETCMALSAETGAQIRFFDEPAEAVKGADYVYTQTWNTDKKGAKKMLPYRATGDLLARSGHGLCKLLHRLPQLVEGGLAEELELDGLEVSRNLFDSAANMCFEQAEYQLFCTEAVLISLLA